MSDVLFKKPDGSIVTVDSSEAQAAQQRGYTPVDEATAQASSQPVLAGAEGAFRGATMGFGDGALADFEKGFNRVEDPSATREQALERMGARKRENPIASTVGEIGGAIGTSVLTGGGASGLVGNGVRGAAFEGGLYGLGSVVSESNLENTPLTAERLGAGMLTGALASGLLHGGFELVKKGVSAGVSKLGGGTLKDMLANKADDVEWGGLSKSNKGWMRRNEKYKGDILALSRKLGISSLDETGVDLAASHADDIGQKIGASINDLERQIPLKGNDALRSELVSAIEARVQKLDESAPGIYGESVSSMNKKLEQLAADPNLDWQKVWHWQSKLYDTLPADQSAIGVTKEVVAEARQAVRDHVFDTVAERVQNGSGAALRAQGKQYATASALREGLENRTASMNSSSGFLRNPLRSASLALGGPKALAMEYAGEKLGDEWAKRGSFISSKVLRSLAESRTLQGSSKALQGRLGMILQTAPQVLGAYRFPLAQALATGPEATLDAHLRFASGPEGQDYMSRLGFSAETQQEVDATGHRIATLDAIQAHADEFDSRLEKGVSGLFGNSPGRRAAVSTPMSAKDFAKTSERLSALMANPENAFSAVPGDMSVSAPGLSGQAAAQVLRTAQFLQSKAPKDPNAALPEALKTSWQPSAEDLDRFTRYKEAVEDPAQVLKNMANGYLSPEQTEALQAVYPALYQDLREKLAVRLMEHTKPISYQQRLAFSTILGPQALGMTPQMAQVIQQSQALAPDPENGQGKKPDGRQKVDQEANYKTQSQKLEER